MSRPVPARESLRDRIAIHAAEIIPSVAVEQLEGEQKRAKVREQIKARLGVQSEDDVRRLLDALLDLPGLAEPAMDVLLNALPLHKVVDALDALLDGIIQGAYRGLEFAGVDL